MLTTTYNPATDAAELQHFSPGPWSLAEVAGARLDAVEWAVDSPDPIPALKALGLTPVDTALLYRVEPLEFAESVTLEPLSDPARAYALFRACFAARWEWEGIAEAQWAELWESDLIEPRVSGLLWQAGEPCGFICAERSVLAPDTDLFYRSFGIHPAVQGQGLGFGLYATSLARAAALGYSRARWTCFASNRPIARLMTKLGATVESACGFWSGAIDRERSGVL